MELLGGEFTRKHNQAHSSLFTGGRRFFGSVRSPWEWYASLWSYGCGEKGAVFYEVTRPEAFRFRGLGWKERPGSAFQAFVASLRKDADQWRRTYRDAEDAGAFREWLYMIHDSRNRFDFGEGYGESPVSQVAGLLSYRYLKLFCQRADEDQHIRVSPTYAAIAQYDAEHCFIDHFIRNEHLEEDLIAALERSGIEISPGQRSGILSRPSTNTSSRRRDIQYYYDTGTEQLIADRERLIIEKFSYVAPSARMDSPELKQDC